MNNFLSNSNTFPFVFLYSFWKNTFQKYLAHSAGASCTKKWVEWISLWNLAHAVYKPTKHCMPAKSECTTFFEWLENAWSCCLNVTVQWAGWRNLYRSNVQCFRNIRVRFHVRPHHRETECTRTLFQSRRHPALNMQKGANTLFCCGSSLPAVFFFHCSYHLLRFLCQVRGRLFPGHWPCVSQHKVVNITNGPAKVEMCLCRLSQGVLIFSDFKCGNGRMVAFSVHAVFVHEARCHLCCGTVVE